MTPSILVAGIGNIFLGDDSFGVEVARAMLQRALPDDVLVKDFGIRGFDLAYTLLNPWEAVILVDALQRNEVPGTLFVVEPDLSGMGDPGAAGMDLNPHGMDPVRVLNMAARMGAIPARVLVIGCEPRDFGDGLEGRIGLSPQVQASVDEACRLAEELIGKIRAERKNSPVHVQIWNTDIRNREVTP